MEFGWDKPGRDKVSRVGTTLAEVVAPTTPLGPGYQSELDLIADTKTLSRSMEVEGDDDYVDCVGTAKHGGHARALRKRGGLCSAHTTVTHTPRRILETFMRS